MPARQENTSVLMTAKMGTREKCIQYKRFPFSYYCYLLFIFILTQSNTQRLTKTMSSMEDGHLLLLKNFSNEFMNTHADPITSTFVGMQDPRPFIWICFGLILLAKFWITAIKWMSS